MGVTVDVGQCFLDDPENDEFQFFFEPAKIFGNVDGDGDPAAFGEKLGIRSYRRGQARFFQKRRMEKRGNEADLAHGCRSEARGGAQQFANFTVAGGNAAADLGEGHLQAGQGLRGGFV